MPTSSDDNPNGPPVPPIGDPTRADKYLNILIDLLQIDRLIVTHSDLSQFDPTLLEDHYLLDLEDYMVEISHSKQAQTGKNVYIMLFTPAHATNQSPDQRQIIAYMHLNEEQFLRFKQTADEQMSKRDKEAEEQRFKEAMAPIDSTLEKILSQQFSPKPPSTKAPAEIQSAPPEPPAPEPEGIEVFPTPEPTPSAPPSPPAPEPAPQPPPAPSPTPMQPTAPAQPAPMFVVTENPSNPAPLTSAPPPGPPPSISNTVPPWLASPPPAAAPPPAMDMSGFYQPASPAQNNGSITNGINHNTQIPGNEEMNPLNLSNPQIPKLTN